MSDAESEKMLQGKFGIQNVLRFEKTAAGLVRAVVTAPDATGELYLQGAHVTGWTPAGRDAVLFLSSRSEFVPGKAIRGGVPVIFPWFGARADGGPGPAHGFARTSLWTLETAEQLDGAVKLGLVLRESEGSRDLGYTGFELHYVVKFGLELEMRLEVENRGTAPLRFEEALHSYFAVSDISGVALRGLECATYLDKPRGGQRQEQWAGPLHFEEETDRVYVKTISECVVEDPGLKRRLVIDKSGSKTTVVWNPWAEKAAGLKDMGPGEWRRMLCVETANAGEDAVVLAPGERHHMTARVRVEAGGKSSPA